MALSMYIPPDEEDDPKKKKRQKFRRDPGPVVICKTAVDEQRFKLQRLMANPDKPVQIPERPKEWVPKNAPEFVRDVMGSSAAAGSGEFHVYRAIRRRELMRNEYFERKLKEEHASAEFAEKVKKNIEIAEKKTAKKRKKRIKRKEIKKNRQQNSRMKETSIESTSNSDEDSFSESELLAISQNDPNQHFIDKNVPSNLDADSPKPSQTKNQGVVEVEESEKCSSDTSSIE